MSENSKSAEWYRARGSDISGNLTFTTATDDTTLVTGKTGWTIFVQEIVVTFVTSAAPTITFEDSTAVTPTFVAVTDASPGVGTQYRFTFGAVGKPLAEAKNFVANFSATGLAGHMEWLGYLKQTGVEYLRGSGTIGTGQSFI